MTGFYRWAAGLDLHDQEIATVERHSPEQAAEAMKLTAEQAETCEGIEVSPERWAIVQIAFARRAIPFLLGAIYESAQRLRRAAVTLQDRFGFLPPESRAALLDTFGDPLHVEMLGAVADILRLEQERHSSTVGSFLQTYTAQHTTGEVEAMGEAFTRGLARSGATCPCGVCEACGMARDFRARGLDPVVEMAAKIKRDAMLHTSGLVDLEGNPLASMPPGVLH